MLVSDEIIKVLDVLAEKFGLAVDWSASNVIPYLEQLCGKYVNYEIATSVVWILIASVFMFVAYRIYKKCHKYEYDNYNVCIVSNIVFGFVVWIPISIICNQIFDIVTCLTFPEKIILDELKSIYTSMNMSK